MVQYSTTDSVANEECKGFKSIKISKKMLSFVLRVKNAHQTESAASARFFFGFGALDEICALRPYFFFDDSLNCV